MRLSVSASRVVFTYLSSSDRVCSMSPLGKTLSLQTLREGLALTSISHTNQLSSIRMSRPSTQKHLGFEWSALTKQWYAFLRQGSRAITVLAANSSIYLLMCLTSLPLPANFLQTFVRSYFEELSFTFMKDASGFLNLSEFLFSEQFVKCMYMFLIFILSGFLQFC